MELLESIIKTVILVRFFYWFKKIFKFVLTRVLFGFFALGFFGLDLIVVVKSWLFHGSRCFTCLPTVFRLIKFVNNWHLRFVDFETFSQVSDIVKIGPYTFNKGLRLDNFGDLIEDFFVMFFLFLEDKKYELWEIVHSKLFKESIELLKIMLFLFDIFLVICIFE